MYTGWLQYVQMLLLISYIILLENEEKQFFASPQQKKQDPPKRALQTHQDRLGGLRSYDYNLIYD